MLCFDILSSEFYVGLMVFEYIVQAIGIFAFVLGVSAFLSKNDSTLKLLISFACFLVSLHFILLGAYVGAGAAALGGVRSFISIFRSARPYAAVFFAAYIPLGYFYIEDWIDVLPILAGLIGTYSMFYLNHIPMRAGLFTTSSIWLIHNIIQGSIGPSLLEAFYICANVKTIYGLKKDKQKKTTFPQ